MKIRPTMISVMTPFPFTIERTASLSKARDMMDEHEIRHLPITHDGKIVGCVSEQELLLAMTLKKTLDSSKKTSLADICTDKLLIVHTSDWVDQVARSMAERHIDAALVMREEKLVGIFTSQDACRVLAEILHRGPRSEIPDDIA